MRKPSIPRKGHARGSVSSDLPVPSRLSGGDSAILHRIRALRAEARAVYAEMAAAVLVGKRDKQ